MGFVPVNLGPAGRAIGKPDEREPLSLPPTAWTVNLAKAFPLPDPCAGGDGFNFGHRTDNLEVHCSGFSDRLPILLPCDRFRDAWLHARVCGSDGRQLEVPNDDKQNSRSNYN